MNTNRVFVIATLTATVLLAASPVFSAGEGIEESRYMCKDNEGNNRWEARLMIKPIDGKGTFLFTEEGRGIYSGFTYPVRWNTETEFLDDGKKPVPIRMKKAFFSEEGKKVFETTQEFDNKNGKVESVKRWLDTGKEVKKTFKYAGDIVNESTLAIYTKRFLKNGEREKIFYLVTNDPDIYKITAKIIAEEELTVNGRKLPAFKIHLKPDVGMLGLFAGMLPQTYVWHLARPGFNWLKYEGAEDTRDSEVVIMETLDSI